MVTTTIAIDKKTTEELKNLPFTKNELNQVRLQLLNETTSSFFLAAPESLPEVIAKTIKLSLKEGAHQSISLIFATYGFSISSFRKNFKRCEEMMELAYEYDDKYNNISSKVICQFIHFGLTRKWIAPIAENATLLMKNYKTSLEVGSISIAYYSLGNATVFRFFAGDSLTVLRPDLEGFLEVCMDKKQTMISDFMKIMLQFTDDLGMPLHSSGKNMEGKYFSAVQDMPRLREENSIIAITLLETLATLKDLIHGQFSGRLQKLEAAKATIDKTGLGSLVNLFNYIFNFLCVLQDQDIPVKTSEKYIRYVREWSGFAYFNFGGWYHLALALLAQRKNDAGTFLLESEKATDWFDHYNVLYASGLVRFIRLLYRANNLKLNIS